MTVILLAEYFLSLPPSSETPVPPPWARGPPHAPKPAPVRRVIPARPAHAVGPAPIVREVVNVEEQVAGIFGTGGTNNVKVETPDFNFAIDL